MNSRVLRVFGYIRCSTEEQAVSGLGLAAQREAIRTWCKLRGMAEAEVIEDPGESGAHPLAVRPGGKQLLDRVQAGNAIVIVARLDRLFRSSSDATATIERWTKSGVMLSSIAESFDMTTATGRFIARTFANFAELERELTAERTKSAMAVKRDRGERITRDAPYGFSFQPSGRASADGKPVLVEMPDQPEQDVIREMREMRRRKVSLRDIAAELNRRGVRPRRAAEWSHTSVRGILQANRRRRLETSPSAEADAETPTPGVTPGCQNDGEGCIPPGSG